MVRKVSFRIFLLLIIGLLIFRSIHDYRSSYEYSLTKRAEFSAKKNKNIHVAVVGDLKGDSGFLDGVMLAVEEINKQGIELRTGKDSIKSRLVIHKFDDSTEESALKARLAIVADYRIIAVLGHSSSATAIPASISYEYNGVLFISTFATHPVLTDHGFKYTFSIIPAETSFINAALRFCKERNWHKLAVLHARNPYGHEFYERLATELEKPLEIVYVKSFFVAQADYKSIIYEVMKKDFDVVVLAASNKNAANMIEQLRGMGVDVPIIGGDGLDNLKIWGWSKQTANQTYVASVFVGQLDFVNKFKQALGLDANYQSYQGYEAVNVLADALRKTGSAEPIRLSSTLKYKYKPGYGGYVFDTNGLVVSKNVYIKQMKDGKFKMVNQE